MNIYALELSRLPNTSLEILVRLAKTLRRDTPDHEKEVIHEAAAALDEELARADDALTDRLVAENPEEETSLVDFDRAVDRLWVLLRQTLEGQQEYAHSGLDALPSELAAKVELGDLRARAARARRLWIRLFGATGTAFVRKRFISQTEAMAALLRMIEREGLREELESVVGEQLPRLLEVCQVHYEDRVSARLSRGDSNANLNELRNDLRWAIVAYINAVHSLYKPKQPETSDLVLDALRSVLTLRALLSRPGGESVLSEGEGEYDLDALDDLLGEEQGEGEGEMSEPAPMLEG